MGWGRMFLLGNLGQQLDIEDQRRDLENLRQELARQNCSTDTSQVEALARENAELRLYLAAIIRYLMSKGLVNPEEFRVLVEEIDKQDGYQDGGFQGKVC